MSEEDTEDNWFIFICAVIVIALIAAAYAQPTYKDVAENLSTSNATLTTLYIEQYLWSHINYTEKDEGIKSVSRFWRTMRGDCSEIAITSCAMARHLKIPSRVVYGDVLDNGVWYRHAWCEYKIQNKWIYHKHSFTAYKRLGFGER